MRKVRKREGKVRKAQKREGIVRRGRKRVGSAEERVKSAEEKAVMHANQGKQVN